MVCSPLYEDELVPLLQHQPAMIARGNGRCYGDASLGDSVIDMLKFNRILSFDDVKGTITCQSGLLLSDVLTVIVPRGWFLPVTPGTRFITVGGAVASDIHGKNHHKEGGFSTHIISMRILTPSQGIVTCSKTVNPELFWFTCGGMGLTGIVLDVTFRLKKIETVMINQLQVRARNLDEIIEMFDRFSNYTYSVAWIDCLGRGRSFGRSILILGEHAIEDQVEGKKDPLTLRDGRYLSVPFNFPSFSLNSFSVRLFNELYYAKNYRREMHSMVTYPRFFYPLDSILNWNRIYGRRGFIQYQFVIPKKQGKEGIRDILKRISEKGWGSFLAVLKLFGKGEGLISFQLEGYTLALDFPLQPKLLPFLDELDKIVTDYGGRVYLSKDARMKADVFHATYPHAGSFVNFLRRNDPDRKIVSLLSQRLELKE